MVNKDSENHGKFDDDNDHSFETEFPPMIIWIGYGDKIAFGQSLQKKTYLWDILLEAEEPIKEGIVEYFGAVKKWYFFLVGKAH